MFERRPPLPPQFFERTAEHGGGTDTVLWAVFGLVLALLVLAVLALAARYGAAWRVRRVAVAGDPLDVVRLRYARGQLSREDYLQASADLGAQPAQPAEPPPD
jgi:uncharacterized membrane protein